MLCEFEKANLSKLTDKYNFEYLNPSSDVYEIRILGMYLYIQKMNILLIQNPTSHGEGYITMCRMMRGNYNLLAK